MKYKIAIPSYKRSTTVVEKTLAYLKTTDIDMKSVTVFVADKKELAEYQKTVKGVKLVVGVTTLRGQRNFMRKYYPKGTNVLFIDDDVEGLYRAMSDKHKDMAIVKNLNGFIIESFTICRSFGVSLWGVGAVCNPFFMYGKGMSFDLKYVIGAFYGEVINHSKSLDVELEDKEDFERTIKHFIACGKVLRRNDYSIKTRYYKESGGMQVTRTKKRVDESARYLLSKYPKYCQLNTTKKNQEFTEIKLIKQ